MSLLVCTPCYGGQVTEGYLRSSVLLGQVLLMEGIEHEWMTLRNESLIPRARCVMAGAFLEGGFSHLMFIDADIEFDPHDVVKLYRSPKPLIGGMYRHKTDRVEYSCWRDGEIVRERPSGVFGCDYLGTGFMMIRRAVLERLDRRMKVGDEMVPDAFDTIVSGGVYLSEDFAFCERWRDTGGKIWCDSSIRLVHHGAMAYGD